MKKVTFAQASRGWLCSITGDATSGALERIESHKVDVQLDLLMSGVVSDSKAQPVGWNAIMMSAFNCAKDVQRKHGTDFGIGVDVGLVEIEHCWFYVPCVTVLSRQFVSSYAYGAPFPIPTPIALHCVEEKSDLGDAIIAISGFGENDALRFYSGGVLTLEEQMKHALIGALCESLNVQKYSRTL